MNATLGYVLFAAMLSTTTAFAQSDPVADAKGFQQNHNYFSQQPFEHIDTYTGITDR